MITRTKAGTKVKILHRLPLFKSNGVITERVRIRNIHPGSPTEGLEFDVNLEDLEEQLLFDLEE